MKKLLIILMLQPMFTSIIQAQALDNFKWKNRVLVLFTPNPDHPQFVEQCKLFDQLTEELEDHKLKVILVNASNDPSPAEGFLDQRTATKYYELSRVKKDSFTLLLIGLDGGEKFRSENEVTPPQKIFDLINTMPMRRQELRQRGDN